VEYLAIGHRECCLSVCNDFRIMNGIPPGVCTRGSAAPLSVEPMDAWLTKWGSIAGGILLVALTVAVLPSQTSSRAEIVLGIGVAVVACANLFLFGILSRQVHLAWHRGAVPWRVRSGEFIGLAVGLAIMGTGVWCIQTLQLTPDGMIIGGLLALTMAIAIMCLGLCFSLSKAHCRQAGGPGKAETA